MNSNESKIIMKNLFQFGKIYFFVRWLMRCNIWINDYFSIYDKVWFRIIFFTLKENKIVFSRIKMQTYAYSREHRCVWKGHWPPTKIQLSKFGKYLHEKKRVRFFKRNTVKKLSSKKLQVLEIWITWMLIWLYSCYTVSDSLWLRTLNKDNFFHQRPKHVFHNH